MHQSRLLLALVTASRLMLSTLSVPRFESGLLLTRFCLLPLSLLLSPSLLSFSLSFSALSAHDPLPPLSLLFVLPPPSSLFSLLSLSLVTSPPLSLSPPPTRFPLASPLPSVKLSARLLFSTQSSVAPLFLFTLGSLIFLPLSCFPPSFLPSPLSARPASFFHPPCSLIASLISSLSYTKSLHLIVSLSAHLFSILSSPTHPSFIVSALISPSLSLFFPLSSLSPLPCSSSPLFHSHLFSSLRLSSSPVSLLANIRISRVVPPLPSVPRLLSRLFHHSLPALVVLLRCSLSSLCFAPPSGAPELWGFSPRLPLSPSAPSSLLSLSHLGSPTHPHANGANRPFPRRSRKVSLRAPSSSRASASFLLSVPHPTSSPYISPPRSSPSLIPNSRVHARPSLPPSHLPLFPPATNRSLPYLRNGPSPSR
ncbi:hypothetical protein C7M84_014094 [Penaeus vannamei]|uniref:Uncharacterized protein n=1 Tax=Penaeus vannamei TaxID=6689 RepID=A0A423SUB4_PENVA|nr:hypothetical protein C7M84_014094 [Penaeus vannamei]